MGVENDIFWSEKGSGFGETLMHTPTKNSQEQSPYLLATINDYWIPLSYYLKNIIIKIEETDRGG